MSREHVSHATHMQEEEEVAREYNYELIYMMVKAPRSFVK